MKKLLILVLIIAALLASGCISDKDATTEEPTENISQIDAAPLMPREVLFGNPDKITVRLSPDGAQVSYLAPVDGVLNVWVGPADDPDLAEPVTNDTDRGIRIYFWAYTNKHILYLQDQAGDENWRVYSVNLETGKTIDLTPLEGVQARIQAVSQEFPEEILITLNDRDPTLHDIYRANITTGEKNLVMENEGFMGFITDDEYNVRFAERLTPDGGGEILKATEAGGWELFMEIAIKDVFTTGIVGFDKTGTILYMIDSRDRNTAAFFTLDSRTGEQTLIAENPRADVNDLMIHPTEKIVQAVAFTYERKHWQIIDESIAGDLAYLKTVADGDVEVVSRTLDDGYWMVAYLIDDGPVQYYYYDREEKNAEFLFTQRRALEGLSLAKMHPVVIESRDGLDLVSYYTLPIGSDSDFDGCPDEPLPMVLFVHGGPWGRDNWGYNSVHQWLANRGYAVLSVNFRSSTGFGKAFINAGNLEWGGKMHDDLIDAVNWTVQEGIADPDQVAIMGGSYGGYATLWGITNTSDTFACGVDIVGISNLTSFFETIPPYWQPEIELIATRMGDARTEDGRAFLAGRSPLTYVDRIEKPLLIGQGANDPRVKQAESDQIVQAMQDANIPVTYLLYTDEGHGFARPENKLSFYAVTDAFLAKHLGGRYEPIGDDFEGSSIIVQSGAEEVPGLAEKSPVPVSTEKSEGALSVSELLESPVYDTEVKVYGIVNHLGQLFCPCFTLYSDRKMLDVQYDMMWEDDGTKRPAVSVEGIENGNWVIVTGELRSSTGTAPSTTFWASNIEKIDAPLAPFSSLQDCQSRCVEAGFERGECKLPIEVELPYVIIGPCVIPSSKHCGDEGQCNCYCYNITRPNPDIKEEEAPI